MRPDAPADSTLVSSAAQHEDNRPRGLLLSTLLLPRDMLVRRMRRRRHEGGGCRGERRLGLLALVAGSIAGLVAGLLLGP